ncbi:Tetratricopeptide repeat 2,FKBP-type peptidyl-prolyl cis-trans isomerase domain,Tetratricopeptide repeat- [Cinara cedri]|uniref:peptidylprolyl isomerase n=1 Tax=Cinara cedri TaxID=506608 RepID=A0A5E4NR65_9HEMI|nr:Tetratricopeptide repeat 2,FKBP-type peptidyl-prolyl cis-trans isomerase domain,Tetratricopeptide repeat- [Cinara cedri]
MNYFHSMIEHLLYTTDTGVAELLQIITVQPTFQTCRTKPKLLTRVGQVVPEDSIVLLHYIGYVSNFHEPFDVTYLQGRRPKSFRLGIGDLLLGLEVAILTMRYGENARIILSPKYAYREMGCPPRIPPNATIVFDVHLVSYYPSTNSRLCDEGENDLNKFQTNLKIVKKLHYEGNECFKTNKINKAVVKYEKAKELLHLTGCNNDQEEIEMFKYLDKLYSNLSICYLKICVFNKVCRMGSEAMRYSGKYSKNNVKLWFNWGKALRLLKDFTEGKKKLQRALKLEPENESIHYELQRLETDRTFHYRIKSLNTFKNNTVNDNNKRLPSEFWQVFDTIINEFVDGTDEILTVALNNNSDDIELAKCKVNLLDLQFQQNENVDSHCFTIKKKL